MHASICYQEIIVTESILPEGRRLGEAAHKHRTKTSKRSEVGSRAVTFHQRERRAEESRVFLIEHSSYR